MATKATKTLARELNIKDLDKLLEPSGLAKEMQDFLELPVPEDEWAVKTRISWNLPPDAPVTKKQQLIARSFNYVIDKASPKFLELIVSMTGATIEDRVKLIKAITDYHRTIADISATEARKEMTLVNLNEAKDALGSGAVYNFIMPEEGKKDIEDIDF